ncbi:YeeE/YedE family protein integral membrane protein [Coccidioides immitis RMSCC 2394]|uniref:YeeE/YedE family protein integral membrane protein n=1 Tax=Coccidioides immitis RMSCC 2394 TaxID=404692 RepID=A0A0J6YHE9_COCIT|nr:YeeE/YedE family protein integral membrane protein [Coccidioides immitis RMSCC 2394]
MFTPVDTALGALLLYQGSSGLLQHNGRVFGISGLLSGCVGRPGMDNIPIVLGIASSIVPVSLIAPSFLPSYPPLPAGLGAALGIAGTGFLVGWGTKNDNGCTSGHMLCGISRLSPRSIIATGIFFVTALITANSAVGAPIPACPGGQPCYTPSYPSNHDLGFISAAVITSQIVNSIIVPRFLRRDEKSAAIYSYIAGLQFGLGLLISGLANPAKVLGFFSWRDLSRFDPSLGLVMLFAVIPGILSYIRMKREYGNEKGKKPPTLTEYFQLPTKTVKDIDWRFVLGAMSFGVGWGLSGVCPGPGLLRSFLQPAFGALWMGGFWLGSLLGL